MKKLLAMLFCFALISCGVEKVIVKAEDGTDGIGCTIQDSFIVCDDGTEFDLRELQGVDGTNGIDGINGQDGENGQDGADGVILTGVYAFPEKHVCVDLGGDGFFGMRACSIVKIYNNDECLSRPSPNEVLCSLNPNANELCWIGDTLFIVEGVHDNTNIYRLDF